MFSSAAESVKMLRRFQQNFSPLTHQVANAEMISHPHKRETELLTEATVEFLEHPDGDNTLSLSVGLSVKAEVTFLQSQLLVVILLQPLCCTCYHLIPLLLPSVPVLLL